MTDFSVYFNKYVNVRDTVYVDKDFDVSAYVKGTSAMANATADALGYNSHTETLTQTTAVQGPFWDFELCFGIYIPSYQAIRFPLVTEWRS